MEPISSNAVIFGNPNTGELFIYDNANSRYGLFNSNGNGSFRRLNGLEQLIATKIVGCNGISLTLFCNPRTNNYHLMLAVSNGVRLFSPTEYIEPFLSDDGRLAIICRNIDTTQARIGHIKDSINICSSPNVEDYIDWGPEITAGLFSYNSHYEDYNTQEGQDYTYEVFEAPEGRNLAVGRSLTAVCEICSTDVFVVHNLSQEGCRALGAQNDTIQEWYKKCETQKDQEEESTIPNFEVFDEDIEDVEEREARTNRRLLGNMIGRGATLICSEINKDYEDNPQKYYQNLRFHHPDTYLDYILMVDHAVNKADLISVARDSLLFITSLEVDDNRNIIHTCSHRLQYDDCIRNLIYNRNKGIIYYTGDSGLYGCLNVKNNYAHKVFRYGKAAFLCLTMNPVSDLIAAYNSDKLLVVFDDSTPSSMQIKAQVPLINKDRVTRLALNGNYLYIQYRDNSLERYLL